MPHRFLAAFVLAIATTGILAQDSVKLKAGGSVPGDIIADTPESVTLVTQGLELKTIARDAIAEVKKGTALDRRVQKWLEGIEPKDVAKVFAVAEKAAKDKPLEFDARRLARRCVAFDPEHAGARTMLGHVKVLGTWYPNAAAAKKALAAKMKEDGFLEWKEGWARSADLAALKANPADFTLTPELIWRRTEELMLEKGMLRWEKDWYPPESKPLIEELNLLKLRLNESMQAAMVGQNRVYIAADKKTAELVAQRNHKAFEWFVKAFEVRDDEAMKSLVYDSFILSRKLTYEAFLTQYPEKKQVSTGAELQLEKDCESTSLDVGQGCVTHIKRMSWEAGVVGHIGRAYLRAIWRAQTIPDWLGIAAAHHAEISVFDQRLTSWVAVRKYGESNGPSNKFEVNTIKGMLARMKVLIVEANPRIRELFAKTTNMIDEDDEVFADALLLYLLKDRKDEFLKFVRTPGADDVAERWQRIFGEEFEGTDGRFRAWIEKGG